MGLLSWFGLSRWNTKEDMDEEQLDTTECASHGSGIATEDSILMGTGKGGRRQPKQSRQSSRKGHRARVSGDSRNASGASKLRVTIAKSNRKSRPGSTPASRRGSRRQSLGTHSVSTELRGRRHSTVHGTADQIHLKKSNSSAAHDPGKLALSNVKTLWKVRPLPVDEKIRVFISGRDDGCQDYCGGEFYQWMKESELGFADPMEAGAYPLVIQDSELRHLLEIKYPSERALQNTYGDPSQVGGGASDKRVRHGRNQHGQNGIKVPVWRELPAADCPENILQHHNVSVVVRNSEGNTAVSVKSLHTLGNIKEISRASQHAETNKSNEQAYIRYMQPTPDELDQAIEYDLDEEDEQWLKAYNKAQSTDFQLKEEWMEHLMDRMEKEYTYELQKHPEKWIVQQEAPQNETESKTKWRQDVVLGQQNAANTSLVLPSISEIFPLKKCLRARGLSLDSKVVKRVYNYWKKKHEKTGRPLLQRLWYEPPWHKKAADATTAASDGDDVFSGYDVPTTLSRIRKRKMNDFEVQSRFDILRRDLEMVRTMADLIRRREKLKRQEMALLKTEWDSRLQDIISGKSVLSTRRHLKSRPPPVLSVTVSGRRQEPHPVSTPKASSTLVEGRAARLAARRSARNEALNITPGQRSGHQTSKRKSTGSQKLQKNKNSSQKKQEKNSRVQLRGRTGRFVSSQRNKRIKSSL